VADGRTDLAERQKQNRSSRVAKARNAFGNHNCRDIIASVLGVAGMSSCPARSSGASTAGIISLRFLEGRPAQIQDNSRRNGSVTNRATTSEFIASNWRANKYANPANTSTRITLKGEQSCHN
jgi:hypothetical protein